MKFKLTGLAAIVGILISLSFICKTSVLAQVGGACGDNLTWAYNEGTLTISGSGAMYDYKKDSETPWYAYQSKVNKLIIGEAVTHIGAYSFQRFSSLTNVIIPDGVTSSGRSAFDRCYGLTGVNIGKGLEVIPEAMFMHCQALESIAIADSVTNIAAHAFYGCKKLKNVAMGKCVEQIGDFAFYMCGELGNVDFPNSIKSIGGAAFAYTKMNSVIIPDGVQTIREFAFEYCDNLTEIRLSDGISLDNDVFYNSAYYKDESKWINGVLYIDNYLIKANTGLSGVYDIRKGTCTIADGAFAGCSALTGITVPESVTVIGNSAFSNTGLVSVLIPDSVKSIGEYTFRNCVSLEEIHIHQNVSAIGIGAFEGCKALRSIEIPDGIRAIENSVFVNCKNLTEITIPGSVEAIGTNAFANCSELRNIYYYGSEEEWNVIQIGTGNTSLAEATIHYLKKVAVLYNLNGAEGEIEAEYVQPGTEVTIAGISGERIGYRFLGWATTSSATEAVYKPGAIVTLADDDLILYAVWYELPYTNTKVISGNGYRIFDVALYKVPEKSSVMLVCYNNDNLVHTEIRNTDNTAFALFNTVKYDEVKIFVWDMSCGLYPITIAENVKF